MTTTDWATVHDGVLAAFSARWSKPEPHAWDGFLHADTELVQPIEPLSVRRRCQRRSR
jgi:hypothetical protein